MPSVVHIKNLKRSKYKILTFAALFLLMFSIAMMEVNHAQSPNADYASTYNNHLDAQVYATDVFGVHMAWVNNNWQYFATTNNGDFMLNQNTKLVTNTGGVWPDGGSITGSSSSENNTALTSSVVYSLNSAVGQHITGTLVNQAIYNGNGNYQYYTYIYGTSYYQSGTPTLPIELSLSFDD